MWLPPPGDDPEDPGPGADTERGSPVTGSDPPDQPTRAAWDALLARADVVEDCVLGSTFGFMAFHGGLEAGTLPIARAAAEVVGASSYTSSSPPTFAGTFRPPSSTPPDRCCCAVSSITWMWSSPCTATDARGAPSTC